MSLDIKNYKSLCITNMGHNILDCDLLCLLYLYYIVILSIYIYDLYRLKKKLLRDHSREIKIIKTNW